MANPIHLLTFDADDLAITRCGLRPSEDAPATTSRAKATCPECEKDYKAEMHGWARSMSAAARKMHG